MMEPLGTNGFDPALLRVIEKRGHEHEQTPRRKRTAAPERASDENGGAEMIGDNNNDDQPVANGTGNAESSKHALDDLA